MRLPLRALALVAAAPLFGAAYLACSSDPPATTGDGGTTPTSTATSTATTPPSGTASTPPPADGAVPPVDSGNPPVDAGCNHPKPVMDGGGLCGTYPFGAATVSFVMTDAGPNDGYDGGTLPPGIYDAVVAERGSALGGAWRETLVLDGTRFTRIRQITASSTPGAVSYRSGTYTTAGKDLTFKYDCAVTGDAGLDAGSDTLPFDTIGAGCDPNLRYGVTGIRITLKRRP